MQNFNILLGEARFSFLGKVLGRVMSMVSIVFITRMVSPEIYGDFTFLVSTLSIFYGFASLGIPRTISYFVPIYMKRNPPLVKKLMQIISRILIFTIIIASIFLLIFSKRILFLFGKDRLHKSFNLLIVILIIYGIRDLIGEYFVAEKDIRFREFVESFLSPIARFLFTIILLALGFKLIGLVLGFISGWIFAVLVGGWIFWRYSFSRYLVNQDDNTNISKLRLRPILDYALPLAGIEVVGTIMNHVHIFLLGLLAVQTAPGLFQLALSVSAIASILPGSLSMISKPIFAELSVSDEDNEILIFFQRSARWTLVLAFPVAIYLSISSAEIIKLLFSSNYKDSAVIVPLIVLATVFPLFWGQLKVFIKGVGKTMELLKIHIITFITVLILDLLLIPRLGIIGAGLSTIALSVLDTLLRYSIVYKYLGRNPYNDLHYKTLASGTLTFFIIFMINWLIDVPFSVIIYPIIISIFFAINLVVFKAIDSTDINVLERILHKGESCTGIKMTPVADYLRTHIR